MKKIILLVLVCLSQFSFNPPALTWVAIGDSITYLNDHANETGNRISKGYMTQVVEQLPHIKFVNKGYNGWTAVTKDRRLSAQWEHTVLVTDSGYEVLTVSPNMPQIPGFMNKE